MPHEMPLTSLLLPFYLAACMTGPNFQPPQASLPAKSTLRLDAAMAEDRWWTVFGDPVLSGLEARAAAANPDVQVAALRLIESRASRQSTASAQFPTLTGDASYEREAPSGKGLLSVFASAAPGAQASGGFGAGAGGVNGSSSLSQALDITQYGLSASWEIDLWGRVRRQIEASDAAIDVSAEDQRAILIESEAEIARNYIDLRSAQAQLDVATRFTAAAMRLRDITQMQVTGGVISHADLATAQQRADAADADRPALQQRAASDVNALGFLLGEPPGALSAELAVFRPLPVLPTRIPTGVPSDLARRRPDIREAEAQLHQATASIGVAKADFYPSLTLNGSVGLQALDAGNLASWGARQYSLGPDISLPIFEGGKLRAILALRETQQKEAALTWQRTLLQAWREVDDALTACADERQRLDALGRQQEDARQAFDIATARHDHGVAGEMDVVKAQQTLLDTEQDYIASDTTLGGDMVQLYKALGGGWQTALPDVKIAAN